MSLKTGTLLESRSSIVCPQTTQFAILRSVLGRRESATEYIAPQWGQKKVPPSGTNLVPIEARRRLLTSPELICAPKGTNSSAVKSAYSKSRHRAHDHRLCANALADVALC